MAWGLVKHRDNFTFYFLPSLTAVTFLNLVNPRQITGLIVSHETSFTKHYNEAVNTPALYSGGPWL